MSVPERIAGTITSHSKVLIAVLLVFTLVIGSGASMVDDDSSLDQFEGDSPEAEASEYISENFSAGEDNTTTVQLIVRGDDVLTKESIRSSLEFQREIRDEDAINATLHDDPIFGVENIVAITAYAEDRGDELEARGEALNESADRLNESADELEAEVEELNETADELEADAEALEASFERLQRDGAQLEAESEQLEAESEQLTQEQQELEARTGILQDALNETATQQVAYEQAATDAERAAINATIEDVWTDAQTNAELDQEQNATFETAGEQVREITGLEVQLEGTIEAGANVAADPDDQATLRTALNETVELQTAYDEAETDAERDQIDDQIESVWSDAADNATLDPTQEAQFEGFGQEVRTLTSERNDAGPIEDAFQLGTQGVFADEFADLEAWGDDLQEWGEELEERGERLDERASGLSDRADEIEERGDELEEWGDDLEERGDELEEWGDDLEERGDELEERGDDLEEEADELEEDADALEDEIDDLSLSAQIEQIESMDDDEVAEVVEDVLADEDDNDAALAMMPSEYEPGSTSADARMTFITQMTDEEVSTQDIEGFEGGVLDAQLDLRDLANQQDEDYIVFGAGIMLEEIDQSMGDSLAIVGPLALLFVVGALLVAYRDPLDILMGVGGIVAVLVWTFGFMGWMGIAFNQMFVAVPVLLIGLSIDYAIHVFMRHREHRDASGRSDAIDESMAVALVGVGVALVWVTATTAIGFLANLVSPIAPIREFGIVSAFGIFSALLIFGVLVPAIKVEVDSALERLGYSRHKRAFGTGGGRFSTVLTVGAVAARRAPIAVIVVTVLITAGGIYGATAVDTSFDEEDFLADTPPEWTQHLPGPLSPGEYHAKDDLDFVNEHFQREDTQVEILVQGAVTDDETLPRIDQAESDAAATESAYITASGDADVESPLSTMQRVAAENETFNESFTAADTTGDEVPDRNVEELYDELFEADSDAASETIYRTDDGEYEAIQLVVSIRGDASFAETTDEMRVIAAGIDDDGTDPRWGAIATGGPIESHIVEQDLLATVLESLLITLVAVFAFLTVAYRLMGSSASLGAVTLLPVVLAVSWILGTMYLLGMPFNVLTGMITSLTIGLGVAYSVHVSSRYTLELDRQGNVWDAMHTTVTGTGGALLGSSATTVGGFGTLALAILPVLQQFGIITGLTIIYAFLGSVLVLPTLLVLWTRYLGPDVSFDPSGSPSRSTDRSGEDDQAPAGGGER